MDAWVFDASCGVIRALSIQMDRVGENSAGNFSEALRLFQKIFGAVVADLFEKIAVYLARLLDVRRIENYFAAIGDGGIGFVHSLGAGPQVRVHFRDHGEHAAEWAIDPLDVGFRGMRGRQFPGFFCRAEINTCDFLTL